MSPASSPTLEIDSRRGAPCGRPLRSERDQDPAHRRDLAWEHLAAPRMGAAAFLPPIRVAPTSGEPSDRDGERLYPTPDRTLSVCSSDSPKMGKVQLALSCRAHGFW